MKQKKVEISPNRSYKHANIMNNWN